LPDDVHYSRCDIRDVARVEKHCFDFLPDHFYNLAGISSVAQSFKDPDLAMEINYFAVQGLLEVIEGIATKKQIKFYQASSSEMFGDTNTDFQDERTPFAPVSPYAESKVMALEMCRKFRTKGLFVSSGILYNHESIYRPVDFVSRRITSQVAQIAEGRLRFLTLGNLEAQRDWGFAGDYVDAMWRMMNHQNADEFVIATGKVHSVRDLVECALLEIGAGSRFEELVKVDKDLFRPRDISCLVGNPQKAFDILGWKATTSFEEMIRTMVRADIEYLKAN
jgi:GDPmannose 4,6-dehydratase